MSPFFEKFQIPAPDFTGLHSQEYSMLQSPREGETMVYNVREITAKSILSKTGLPDADWVVNPYAGCAFGCAYCYAYFVGRFTHPSEPWGTWVDAKTNAPQLLAKELAGKLRDKRKPDIGTIFMSSVTDPYQGAEAQYKLTRGCLEVLANIGYTGSLGILTKSTLVTRDIDIFKRLPSLSVGMTVTATDDPVTSFLETNAPPNAGRLVALRNLHDAGISTYAFVGPLLPHFVRDEKRLAKLLTAIKNTGVGYIYLEHLNLSPYIRDRLLPFLVKKYPELVHHYEKANLQSYRDPLDAMLAQLTEEIGLPVAHSGAIYHKNKESWKILNPPTRRVV